MSEIKISKLSPEELTKYKTTPPKNSYGEPIKPPVILDKRKKGVSTHE